MGPRKEKIQALEEKMQALGIERSDIELKFIKASGRGGQKINKSSVAVFVKHNPTGLTAKCGKHRSQYLNRFLALRTLVEKIDRHINNKSDTRDYSRIVKQKKKRRKKARAKVEQAKNE